MVDIALLIALVPLLPLAGFLLIALNVKRFTHVVASVVACSAVLFSFGLAIALFFILLNTPTEERFIYVLLFDWIQAGSFAAPVSFYLDPLSSTMLLIITGVGFLIHIYSVGYMHGDEGFNRFFSYLNLFVFFMLVLVMGSNYLIMFVGWEGVGLCSYLLIGFWFKNRDYTDAANKAFIMNRIGDLGLILGVILIFVQFGTIQFSEVFAQLREGSPMITVITILLFIGAMGKSAQLPLYTWLPDAMAGPTPVSALIHAATMVTAGVYMVARNNLLYSLSPIGMNLVLIVGLATALFAATIAVAQNDIKKVLAYSTVSQLGLMFVALGVGAYSAGIFHMTTHAFFKALLFLGAGSVIHGLHNQQDIRKMGGLKKYLPITYLTFLVGVLAISGIPPFAGFFSKDEILAKAFEHNVFAWAVALLTSLLTVFYMFRLLFLTFFGTTRAGDKAIEHIHESPQSITVPLMILAFLSLTGGFLGVPEALWGSNRIAEFLTPVFESSTIVLHGAPLSHAMEYTLMGTVTVLTLFIIAVAYNRYVTKGHVPAEEGTLTGVHKLVYYKYFVDEHYDAFIVRPLQWMAGQFNNVIEKLGIDGFVNGVGNSVVSGSRGIRVLQSGNIGYYIIMMVVSIVLILAYTMTR